MSRWTVLMVRIIFLIFFSMHVYAEEIENDVVKERRCEQAKDNYKELYRDSKNEILELTEQTA